MSKLPLTFLLVLNPERKNMVIKIVNLSENKTQIIPEAVWILNSDQEGKRPYAYFAWISPLDKNNSASTEFNNSVAGKGLCYPFLYFTNCKNLWKAATFKDPSITPNKEELTEYQDLILLIAQQICSFQFACEPLIITCALCDCTGRAVPVGSSAFQIRSLSC